MAFRQWLYGKIREVSQSFGYQEYDGPSLETLDLYAAKSGEELVNEQSFIFSDRGGDRIALRPELTPTLARMVAQKQQALPRPIRWWSFGPFWRYERPQKGRTREFFQWNIDLIGTNSEYADAEIVGILVEFFRSVGLTPEQVGIKYNDRKLIEAQLKSLATGESDIVPVYRLIDKLDKLSPDNWLAYGKESTGLNMDRLAQIRQMLTDQDLWKQSEYLKKFLSAAGDLGISDYLEYDPSIIRGLDYYTDLVFEAWDKRGEYRAILGGGRYGNLVADVGGEPLGGIGFAMGDVVIGLLLERYGLKPDLAISPTEVLVAVFSNDLMSISARLAAQIRKEGIRTELFPEAIKLDKQLKYAGSLNIPFAIIIGPDEAANGLVMLKNLKTGEQISIEQSRIASIIRDTLHTR
jgi:histidyl-tRNA synthetase